MHRPRGAGTSALRHPWWAPTFAGSATYHGGHGVEAQQTPAGHLGCRFSTQKGPFAAENTHKTQCFSKLYGNCDIPTEHPQPWCNLLLPSASHPGRNSIFLANDGDVYSPAGSSQPQAGIYLTAAMLLWRFPGWRHRMLLAQGVAEWNIFHLTSNQVWGSVSLSTPLRETRWDLWRSCSLERGQQVGLI